MYLKTYAKKYTNVLYGTEKHRDLCKKNYRDVLYGTDDNVETYAKKSHKCFKWDRRQCRDLCKKKIRFAKCMRTQGDHRGSFI